MGLLKAGAGALGGVLADQWREFFYCESLDADTLVAKGEKRVGKRSSNKKGDDNIISNGSIISINEGQSMIIVESGKIVEFCAEAGEFVYDNSTEPSIFCGSLGETVKQSFAQVGKRFTFGGEPGKDQRVYYFNTKEITGNKFGTSSPVPFRVTIDESMNYKLSVDLRCNGVSIPEDQRKKITEWEENVMTTNPNIAAARIVGGQTDAMRTAAANEGGMGAMGGFFGMSMAQNAGGMNAGNLFAMGQQQQQPQQQAQQPSSAGWSCECGQTGNNGKFCMNCGKPQAQTDGWTCSCGTVNKGKFCQNCGNPKPAGAPLYKCDKCGWEPQDPQNPPKFCPECGDIFDDNDKQ